MSKEVLLYGPIFQESATEFIEELQKVDADEAVTVRLNSEGGSPEYTWGMVAKFQELKGEKLVKVDGMAYSMGMYFLCYCDDSEASEVSEFLFHRCSYPDWIENNPEWFTEPMKENLARVNASLQKALAAKIDVKVFEALPQMADKNIKFKDIFSMDGVVDIFINATDAKKIGLINRVVKITPAKAAEINALYAKTGQSKFKKAALGVKETTIETTNENLKNNTMNIEKLKAEFPEVYKDVVKLGVNKERDRVKACLVFNEIDPIGVKAAIISGEKLSEEQKAEFSLKSFNKAAIDKLKDTNKETIITGAVVELSEKEKEAAEFLKSAGIETKKEEAKK